MKQWLALSASLLLLISAAAFAIHRAQEPEYIGIDFVQFYMTGFHVAHGGDPAVYADDVRTEILNSAWQRARVEDSNSKFFHAANFRHERAWETYSSPFLYAVFGAFAGKAVADPNINAAGTSARSRFETTRATKSYEAAINWYWAVCLGATIIGFMTFGWVLRIPCSSMLLGAAVMVWFSPLRIDMNVANVNQIQFGMVGVLTLILSPYSPRLSGSRPKHAAMQSVAEPLKESRLSSSWGMFFAGVWLGSCMAFKPGLLWCGVTCCGALSAATCRAYYENGDVRKLLLPTWLPFFVGEFIGGLASIMFSLLFFPLSSWIDWIHAVQSMPNEIIRTEQGNFSTTYYLMTAGFPNWALKSVGPVLALTMIAVPWIRKSVTGHSKTVPGTNTREAQTVGSEWDHGINWPVWIALGCQIHLLTSHLVWYHYCMLSLPAILILGRNAAVAQSLLDRFVISATIL